MQMKFKIILLFCTHLLVICLTSFIIKGDLNYKEQKANLLKMKLSNAVLDSILTHQILENQKIYKQKHSIKD